MTAVDGTQGSWSASSLLLRQNSKNDELAKLGAKFGKGLDKAEKEVTKAIESGDSSRVAKAQYEYQKQSRMYVALSELAKNVHDIMMTVIRNLRFS